MNDPVQLALQRARQGEGDLIGEPTHDPQVIRKPGRSKQTINDDTQLQERGTELDDLADLTGIKIDHLNQEERDALLEELLRKHNIHTDRKRDIDLKNDELDLDNKRKFSALGLQFASGFGIFFLLAVTGLIVLIGYAVIYDKNVIDGTIIGAFLSTFAEVFKTIFSTF